MLYELLAGRAPFADRAPHRTLAAHLSEAPVPVGDLRLDCPPRLADLVTRLLAKDPGARPQDAQALITALDGVASAAVPSLALPDDRRATRRMLVIYAASSVGAALLTKAAVVVIGLPDWVFPTAVVLLLLGLPALLTTAYVQPVTGHVTATPARARTPAPSERTRQPDTAAGHGPRDGAPALDSVAVLAFRDPQCDGGSDYFTEGITNELITALAKVAACAWRREAPVSPRILRGTTGAPSASD